MRFPTLGIGPRILILGTVTLAILTVLVWGAYTRGVEVLRGSAEEAIRGRTQALAAELDRSSLEALTAARGLALAVEDGGVADGDRCRALARGLLEGRPRFIGAWIALEGAAGSAPALYACRRDAIDTGAIDRLPSDALTTQAVLGSMGYERVREAATEGGRAAGGTVAKVRRDDGRMVIAHVWPIMSGGRFVGAAAVSCALAEWESGLSRVRDRLARAGWSATLSVLGPEGEVIATTSGEDAVRGDSPAWRNLLEKVRRESDGLGDSRSRSDDDGLLAGAEIPTPGWTVVAQLAWSAITSRAQRPMFDILLAACGALGLLMAALSWLAGRVGRRVRAAAAAARRVAEGDLTAAVGEGGGSDETGQLLRDVSHMTASLRGIVERVKDAGSELSATSRDLASAEAHQEEAIHSLGASTTEAAAASREISVTGRELLAAMDDVATVANETAAVAGAGRENLGDVGETMHDLEESAAEVGERLGTIRQRAEDINMVITTITKVADQTNLLSINAAIEAEKAGEYGQGFIVVAREIRRLADQTAVATLDIERLVEQMQQAVGAGVSEMERFAAEVKQGVNRVAGISGQFADVIGKVQGLSNRFDQVNEGMRAQAAGAQQIAEALVTLTDGSRAAADALQEFQGASRQMARAVDGLNESVSRFRLGDSER